MAPTRPFPAPRGPAQDRLIGRVLGGRYRVLSRLGEGGMGTVYLCEHAVLGRRYAVKVLRPDLGGDAELAARFRNEAIAASRIGGENVVDVLDYGAEDDGAQYYVMEALEGRSLGAIVAEEGPLEPRRALALLEQMCRALAAAHASGVVHRDVKPDNVFVVRRPDGAEQVKVIDFGISQVPPEDGTDRLTRDGAIIGTPEYMAPEQAAGDPVDHRADVYALGVLAYELLTGTLPIIAHTPVATLVAHQTRTPDAPSRRRPSISPAVDALVLQALAKRPEDRPQTMDAFADAIARVRNTPEVLAGRVERTVVRQRDTVALPEAWSPRARRVRVVGVVIAGVALAVTVGGAAWWMRERGAGATPTPTPTATPTPTPTATPTPSPSPSPPAQAGGEGRGEGVNPTPAAPAPSPEAKPAPRRKPSPRPPPPPAEIDPHLEDPYGASGAKTEQTR